MATDSPKSISRLSYAAPQLTVYGNVDDLTRGGGHTNTPSDIGSVPVPSDRALKANIASVDQQQVLAQLAQIPIQTWNYKKDKSSVRHIGPMAQDFRAAFNVGEDDKTILSVDAQGVSFAAIQALNQVVQEQRQHIAKLEARLAELEKRKS